MGAFATAAEGWCSAWSADATTRDGCRRRRDGRAGEGLGCARVLDAVEMGEARNREEAVAMASRCLTGEIAQWP